MAYCGDNTETDGECPEASAEPGESSTDCGGIVLAHDDMTLEHQCVSHVNPFYAVYWRVRTA